MDNRSSAMRAMVRRLFGSNEVEGQALVEYVFIFVFMIIVTFAILVTLSEVVYDKFFVVVGAMP
jgi:hypothetical protein